MQPLFLDQCPTYIPFVVQATKADGDRVDPTVDSLIIYEEGGADATFDSTQVTGSPFDPAKVNSKTGLWGALVAKSVFTAGKIYVALWEMTVDSKTTAKVEIFHAMNASSFKADVSSLATQSSVDTIDGNVDAIKTKTDSLAFTTGNVHAHTKATDDIDLTATQKASVNAEVDAALDTAVPANPTADSINERIKTLDADVKAVQGSGWEEANDNLHTLRGRFDDTYGNLAVDDIPSVTDIRDELERAGGVLDSIKTTVDVNLDAKVSERATLGTGNTPNTHTVVITGTSTPIPDVLVEVRTVNDETVAPIAWGNTNDSGQITFYLNAGVTYYFFRRKAGYNFTNPVEVTP